MKIKLTLRDIIKIVPRSNSLTCRHCVFCPWILYTGHACYSEEENQETLNNPEENLS